MEERLNHNSSHPIVQYFNTRELPDDLDWRTRGVINPIRDQGMCGSCWAFAATSVLEAAYAIENGKLIKFSEQQLLDCANKKARLYRSQGCRGGLPHEAFLFGVDSFLALRDSYPYKGLRGIF